VASFINNKGIHQFKRIQSNNIMKLIKYTFTKATFILLLFSCPLLKAQTGIYVPELHIFDTRMAGLLNKYQIPGGQMAVTYHGRLVYNRGFGYADTATSALVQPNSIFRLASISKSITSIAIMHLFENGLLNLDQKVFGTLGILNDTNYQSAIDSRYYDITVRQLLNHTSGLFFPYPTDPLFKTYDIAIAMGVPPPTDSLELVIQWTLENDSLFYTPGTDYGYTNFGYEILGKIIEKITNKDYEDYVTNTILLPLNINAIRKGRTLFADKLPMEVSYYDYPGAPLMPSIYTGIPNSVPAQYGGYNWEVMTAAGGWVASAGDLCKFLVAVDKFTTKPDILLSSTIDTMLVSSVFGPKYALGWNITGKDYWNAGGIQGTATVFKRNESHQLNWAILFNSLPKNYGPFYSDFINLVTDELVNISAWPKHDLFDTKTNVNEIQLSQSMNIFPNPSSDMIYLEMYSDHIGARYEAIDLLGRVYREGIVTNNHFRIDIADLPSGIYLLRIDGITKAYRFIRQ